MPFSENIRDWWMRVGNNKCQYIYYEEKRKRDPQSYSDTDIIFTGGWKICGRRAEHVHHIIGQAYLIEDGKEPNFAVGLPLCKYHHILSINKNPFTNEEIIVGEKYFSFHPDAGIALRLYKEYMYQLRRFGRESAGINPFDEMEKIHIEKAKRGEIYWEGDELREFYLERMGNMAVKYVLLHPEDSKPSFTRRNPITPKRHWSYACFD